MGGEDDIGAAIASAVLIGVAAQGYRKAPFYYVRPGMHANFVIHGVLGLINYQSGVFKLDVAQPFKFSTAAAKYLAIPCLMADMTTDRNISALHVISGAIPFVLELANQPNPQLGNIVIVVNIIALCYHAFKAERRWEWYCAGASILAYFVAPTTGAAKIVFPCGLALIDFCVWKMFSLNIQF